jgi:hypothetical protein
MAVVRSVKWISAWLKNCFGRTKTRQPVLFLVISFKTSTRVLPVCYGCRQLLMAINVPAALPLSFLMQNSIFLSKKISVIGIAKSRYR